MFISGLNKYMDDSEPWNSIKKDKESTGKILTQLIEGFKNYWNNFTTFFFLYLLNYFLIH